MAGLVLVDMAWNIIILFDLFWWHKCSEKKNLVEQTEKMKGNSIVDSHIKDLCYQVEKLTESLNQLISANEKTSSELIIGKNVNTNLE